MERFLTPDEAAKTLRMSRRWIYELLNKGTLQGHKAGDSWRIPEEEVERYLGLEKRGVNLPTELKTLDFLSIRQPLGDLMRAMPNLLERDRSNKKLAASPDLRFVLSTYARVVEYTSVAIFKLTSDSAILGQHQILVSVPPLLRTLLDVVMTLTFLLEDVEPRLEWFIKGGWWEARQEKELYERVYGSDPVFRAFLDGQKQAFDILERGVKPTPAEKRRSPKRNDYWPTPSRMPGLIKVIRTRVYLEHLRAWFYRDLSASSHLTFLGVRDAATFLKNAEDPDVREIAIRQYQSNLAFRNMGLVLAAWGEIEIGLGGLDQNLRYKMIGVWEKVAGIQPEIRGIYELRYSDALAKLG